VAIERTGSLEALRFLPLIHLPARAIERSAYLTGNQPVFTLPVETATYGGFVDAYFSFIVERIPHNSKEVIFTMIEERPFVGMLVYADQS